MAYNFTKLTPTQRELLTFGGWHMGSKLIPVQPGKSTVRKLIDRGLVVPHDVQVRRAGIGITITEYEVPLPVHMAWCDYCAKHFKGE